MADITGALAGLEADAVQRVLRWATAKFGKATGSGQGQGAASDEHISGRDADSFADFASIFNAANPSTAPDKALVAGYWFQVVQGHDSLDSFQLNRELKHLGHPSTNITRDLDSLMNRAPRLVIQVKKSGTTKQARKRYKLTTEGVRAVKTMLGTA